MQPSALFADESALFVIHQLHLLNTEQFSLKVQLSAGRQKSPVRTNTCKLSPCSDKCHQRKTKNVEMWGGMTGKGCWEGDFRDTTTLKQQQPSHKLHLLKNPSKNCRCFCRGLHSALQILKLLLLNKK